MSQKASLQTPRAKVRHLGSAKGGTLDAWRLRLTSFALVPLTIAFVVVVLSLIGRDYDHAKALLGSSCPAILLILFIGAGVWHMSIGMKAVIDDYIHSDHLKSLALMANSLFSAVLGLSCIYAVFRLSFL